MVCSCSTKTDKAYKWRFLPFRFFQTVSTNAFEILKLSKEKYEDHHKVTYDDENDCDDDCGCNINEGYNYSDSTYLAIKNYVEGRIEAGLPPTLKSIQSRLKGIHISCQEIKDICLELGFTVQNDDDTALSNSLVTGSAESDDQ